MKIIKQTLTFILVAAVMMSILILPASAEVGGRWKGKFQTFDRLQLGSKGNFVYALQRYLMSFDDRCRSLMVYTNSAGEEVYMDGDFGSGTKEAVKHVQSELGYSGAWIDGLVYEGTWGKIELDLDRYTDNAIILKRSLYSPYYIYKITSDPILPPGEREVLFYYYKSNTGGTVAFAWA